MQSNTTRAVTAHSKLWPCANRQFPRLVIAAIACVTVLGASNARAADMILDVGLPFIRAYAHDSVDDSQDSAWCAAGLNAACPGQIAGSDLPVRALASVAGAGGEGAVGSEDFAVASAASNTSAYVEELVYFTVEDPQNRPQVKTILDFNAVAETRPDPLNSSRLAGAQWHVKLGASTGGDETLRIQDDGSFAVVAAPQFVGSPVLEMHLGVDSANTGACRSGISMHDLLVSSDFKIEGCPTITRRGSLDLTHAPGTYLMSVIVSASDDSTVVADPVLRPHPDNPDVIVRRLAPTGSPGAPLSGMTPADLAARGIDPTPFIEAGFFDPPASEPPPPPPPPPSSGDTTPPATRASATPNANVAGWNNTPVSVTLSATDNAGGSGVKEVHYSLAGAATGSQVVSGDSANVTISTEGTTTLTYFAVDNAGNQEAAKTLTARIDKTSPAFAGLPATGCTLWPPDHRLVNVASVSAVDGRSGVTAFTLDVTSNEPETGTGDGDVSPDVVITGGTVQVRAERAGNGAGRLYTITARATDQAGNVATETRTCAVPHDRR